MNREDHPMTTAPTAQTGDVYYDPYDVDIDRDPYPTYARLRDEAPIYYNEPHDFYAVSRHADVAKGVADRDTFISKRRQHSRTHQVGHRDAAGPADLRGPAHPYHPPQAGVEDVHRQGGCRTGTENPGVLGGVPGSARRHAALRPDRRVRRRDADARHRHAARHSRAGSGGHPRQERREPARESAAQR